MTKLDRDGKIVFAVLPDGQGDGAPVVILGIPKGAWEYMKDGKTHTFDLTSIGLPIKLILFGADDHASAMKAIDGSLQAQGVPYFDKRAEDFSIHPKPTAKEPT
jgi:hypothetical protein